MIRHVVAFQLLAESPEQRATDAAGIRSILEPLKDEIPGVLALDVRFDLGLVATHWPVILISDYPDNATLEAYQAHPAHREAIAWINTVVADRAVVDFEV